jgi:hypothetical protein
LAPFVLPESPFTITAIVTKSRQQVMFVIQKALAFLFLSPLVSGINILLMEKLYMKNQKEVMILTSLLMKIFICPLGVILSAYLFPNVNFPAFYQPILLGLILAGVGVMMEYLMLKEGTLWMSTVSDFIASVLIVYFVSLFFPGAEVTFLGAILVGLVLGVTEYFTHRWLIQNGRTQKSPA